MRAARFTWNVAISAMLGTMIGLIGHQFAADAIARLLAAIYSLFHLRPLLTQHIPKFHQKNTMDFIITN